MEKVHHLGSMKELNMLHDYLHRFLYFLCTVGYCGLIMLIEVLWVHGVTEIFRNHPLGMVNTADTHSLHHDNLANCCWDLLLWTEGLDNGLEHLMFFTSINQSYVHLRVVICKSTYNNSYRCINQWCLLPLLWLWHWKMTSPNFNWGNIRQWAQHQLDSSCTLKFILFWCRVEPLVGIWIRKR